MDVELSEVRAFLAEHEPFASLPSPVLDQLPSRLLMRYVRRGTVLLRMGEPNNHLFIVRSGAADIVDATGALVERTEPGGSFGASSVLSRQGSRYTITAIEDSLVLVMGSEVLHHLVEHYPVVRDHYAGVAQDRMRHAVNAQTAGSGRSAAWLRTRLDELPERPVVTAPSTTSVRGAAQLMTQHRVSALPVVDDGRLVGIVTDRDLRSKVVAQGLDVDRALSSVMTPDPVFVAPSARAFEALLEMTSRGVHHLPVVQDGRLLAMVSAGDIMRLQQLDPVYLVGDIARQKDVAQLAALCRRTPLLVQQLVQQDASADDIGRLLSTIADEVARRLVSFAVADLGPAPCRWSLVVLGSQARRELGLASDQDHALVLDDGVTEEGRVWFTSLAERLVDGLAQCGYPRCDGDVMSSNPQWRLTVQQWRQQFAHWTNQPDPEAVLHSQIFFDARTIVGDPVLLDEVRRHALSLTPGAQRFLGQLAVQAVERQPPIGFFRGFVLARRGEQAETFDLKAEGLHAVIELARVHALAHGVDAVGTVDRLRAVAALSGGDSLAEVADAFEFIGHIRYAHQARQARDGTPVDNLVHADELSSFDRRHLKDAFSLVRSAQEGLAVRFQTHLMH